MEKPLLGHGPGPRSSSTTRSWEPGSFRPEIFFDNQYLNTLSRSGPLGRWPRVVHWGRRSRRSEQRGERPAGSRSAHGLRACRPASPRAWCSSTPSRSYRGRCSSSPWPLSAVGSRCGGDSADERKSRRPRGGAPGPSHDRAPRAERVRAADLARPRSRRLAAGGSGVALAAVERDPHRGRAPAGDRDRPLGRDGRLSNRAGEPHAIEIPRETYTSETIPPGGTLEHVFDGRAGTYIVRQVGSHVHQGRVVVEVDGDVTLTADESSLWKATHRFGHVDRSRLATDLDRPGRGVRPRRVAGDRHGGGSRRRHVSRCGSSSRSVGGSERRPPRGRSARLRSGSTSSRRSR